VRHILGSYVFVAPNLVAVGVFLVFPLLFSLYMSFHKWDLFSPPQFVGVDNYVQLVTKDPLFWTAFLNTVLFTVITIVPGLVFSLLAAAALNQKLKGVGVFRAILFLPIVASMVTMSVIWRWLFDTDNGVVNWALGAVGIGSIGWLTDPHFALTTVALTSIWKSVPFSTVILLAAMQGVPQSLYEQALIDGAGAVRRFVSVTVPLIRPAISFVLVISVINSFQVFDAAYVMTDGAGGPGTSTYVFGIMLFQNAFRFYQMGYASALAWIIFAILLVLTLLNLRMQRRATAEVYHDAA
jgi:multiple sugar transport system permease protein